MAQKPTYEDLLERNQQIEQEAFERKQTENMALKSESSLSSIFRAAPIGIGVVGDNRVFKEVNLRLCEMLGYSREELLGKSARMLYLTDEDFEYVGKEKYAQIHDQGLGTVETRMQCKDGKVIDVLLSSAPIDPNDLSVGVTFTVLDITSRIQAEKAVQKSEERYRLLVESTPDWVWICDKDSRQTFSNKAVRKILGYEIHEILGTKAFNLIHREDRESVRKWFQKSKKQKRGWKGSVIRWQHKDGSIRFLETIAEPILDDKGNLIGFTGIDRDVTARIQSEEALENAHDKLEQRVKERTAELVLINENLQQEIEDRQHAEAELVKSKAMFKAVVESLPFDVFAIDPDNRYILQNSICKKNWGDLIGKSPEDLTLNKKTKDLWMENNRRALSGETVTGEVVYDRLDGGKNFYYNIITPICDGKKILGILGVLVDISDLKQAEALLRESESKLSAMLSSIGDHMSMMDKDLNIIWANEIAGKIFGNDIIGKKCYEVYHKRTEPCEPYPCITLRTFQDGKIHKHDTQVIDQDGKTIFFHCTANVGLRDKEGKPTAVLEISRDITEKVRAEKALHKAKNELERRVKERTRELEVQKNGLKEINTAMTVLLKKREEDKTELESNVLTNVKELVEPYFEKIKKTKLDDHQEAFLSIIESNLKEIISPFTRKMSMKYLNLTPTEIRIANLIRHGSSSKKIAKLQNVSPRTIDTHRKNIRRKIGLQGQRGNLRSHLLSLH